MSVSPTTVYTTFIERESCFVKVWVQKEKNISLFIENSLMQMKPQFDAGVGTLTIEQLQPGLLCCARFKDNSYYRARITNVAMRVVEVLFIDYGNRDLVPHENIRTISNFPTSVISMPEQAKDFILARLQLTDAGGFPDPHFEQIANEIRYLDFEYQYVAQVGHYSLLSLSLGGRDLAESFTTRQLALPIEIPMQLMMLQSFLKVAVQVSPRPLSLLPQQQQQQPSIMAQQSPPMQMHTSSTPLSPGTGGQPNFLTYKSIPLKVGTEHTVYVSYVNDGPCLFSIQLQNKELELQELMSELNKLPLMPIEDNILPGCVCLARSSEDNYICRAVVTNMVEDSYKVFFVDFGNAEVRSFDNLFQIPFKYVIPKVMATRFTLHGIQGQVVSLDMKVAFKTFVDNKALKMRVCTTSPKTGLSVCELWDSENVSALNYVRDASLQAYPDSTPLTRAFNQDVKVCYVFSCVKFYVQLRKKEEELNKMMQDLQGANMRLLTQNLLRVNAPCIALYEADGMYYRAQILSVQGSNVTVKYVDYGNEESIPVKNIRAPMMEFITNLRPQAIECCLNGYQNMENDVERDNLLEELLLEKYFSMKVADVQESRILVELFDAQLYNVASLLLDRMAKNRSQVSPALVQDNRIDQRKTMPTKYSPKDKSDSSWRDKGYLPRKNSSDWRQLNEGSSLPRSQQNSFDGDKSSDYRKKAQSSSWSDRSSRNSAEGGESTAYQERRKLPNLGDRSDGTRAPHDRDNSWGRLDNAGAVKSRSTAQWDNTDKLHRSDWNEGKRQDNWASGDRRDSCRENSWGNGRREKRFDSRKENAFDNRRENSFDNRSDQSGDSKKEDSWDTSKHSDRDLKTRLPRADNTWGDHSRRPLRRDARSEDVSEMTSSTFKPKRDNFAGSPHKKNFEDRADYADLSDRFATVNLTGSVHKTSVSWFYNPTSFYLQLEDKKAEFDRMMKDIQYAYRRRKPLDSAAVGDSVIALFPEDRALYRATILEVQTEGVYKVIYVDFGNATITNKVYKVERRFMELSAQAVQCGITDVHSVGPQWPKPDTYAQFFGENMDCQFGNAIDSKYVVDITVNGKSLKETLQAADLAIVANPYEHFDITYLLSQQIYCKLHALTALDDFSLEIQPGLIISCAIYKHDEVINRDFDLLKMLVNQMIIAYVDIIQGSKAFVTLYNISGYYIPVIELQEEMFDYVNPICQTLITGPYLLGYVSHATSDRVFVQMDGTANNVERLLGQLFECYDTSELEEFEVKEIVYAVKSLDLNWYRGLVKNIDGDMITVQFIDYGNEEVVNKSALRPLCENFFTPHLAAEIVLKDAITYLDLEVKLKVVFDEDNWVGEVVQQQKEFTAPNLEVAAQSECVHQSVAEQIPKPEMVEPQEPLAPFESVPPQEQQLSPIGFAVELSHLDNPGQFYLQVSSALGAIAHLQSELQSQIDSLADIENITTGVLCAALYSVNETWYRAQVLDADSDITTVRFIDYGNTDVLHTNTKIKTLPAELLSLEEHAKRCSLHLTPKNGEWAAEACSRFEEMTSRARLTAEIIHQNEKTTFVRLYADNICVNDVFIQEGFATEMQAPQAAFTGFVSTMNSPAEFWLQFEHACNDLEWIAEQLTSADKFTLLEDQAPGTLCAAIFPEDENWYRARILSNTVAGVEVLFIDYGNSCTSTSLRELPEELVMVPALAHKCSLLKPQGLMEWPVKATDKFKEISADGVTVFTVLKHSQGETNQVQLLYNDDDVSEILKPELFDATVLSCTNLNEFALRKCDLEGKFVEVQSKIQELSSKPAPEETIVAALQDNVFYRAKINGVIVDKYVVDLFDLGIEADVTELRQLPKEIADVEPLAMSAKMNSVVGYAFDSESDTYFKTLCETVKVFQVELVTDKAVKLYMNGSDVRNKMPVTKCTSSSSVQSTPRKPPAKDTEADIDAIEVQSKKEEQVVTSPILLRDTISDAGINMNGIQKEFIEVGSGEKLRVTEDEVSGESQPAEDKIKAKSKIIGENRDNRCDSEEALRDADMITSVTDEPTEKVLKQCSLLEDVASAKVDAAEAGDAVVIGDRCQATSVS